MKEYTNTRQGLSEPEVQERLASFGYNELPSSKSRSLWKLAWEVITEPMLLLLVAGSGCQSRFLHMVGVFL